MIRCENSQVSQQKEEGWNPLKCPSFAGCPYSLKPLLILTQNGHSWSRPQQLLHYTRRLFSQLRV